MRPNNAELKSYYKKYLRGMSKNQIERDYLQDPKSHGKRITKLWRDRLGIETEGQHPLAKEVERLNAMLYRNGIDPATGRRSK